MDKFRFRKERGRIWFRNRTVSGCNKLNEHEDTAKTIESLKWKLNNVWMRKGDCKDNSQEIPFVGRLASCSLPISLCTLAFSRALYIRDGLIFDYESYDLAKSIKKTFLSHEPCQKLAPAKIRRNYGAPTCAVLI